MTLLSTQKVGSYGNVDVIADFAQMTFFWLGDLGTQICLLAIAS